MCTADLCCHSNRVRCYQQILHEGVLDFLITRWALCPLSYQGQYVGPPVLHCGRAKFHPQQTVYRFHVVGRRHLLILQEGFCNDISHACVIMCTGSEGTLRPNTSFPVNWIRHTRPFGC